MEELGGGIHSKGGEGCCYKTSRGKKWKDGGIERDGGRDGRQCSERRKQGLFY